MKSLICTARLALTLILIVSFGPRASEAAPTSAGSVRVSTLSVDEWELVWVGVDANGNDVFELRPASTADLASVSVSPGAVTGGATATGTVTLSSPAGAGGSVVALTTDNSAAVSVPAS